MIHKIICIHKIVISKRRIMNFTHFADARNFLLKLERRAQFSLQNANHCGCYRAISVKYFLIKETSKGGADLAASSTENLKFIVELSFSIFSLEKREERRFPLA